VAKERENDLSGIGSDDARLLSDVLRRVIDTKSDEPSDTIARLREIVQEIDVSKRPDWESPSRQQAELINKAHEKSETEDPPGLRNLVS
jgi:hypothetical protein